MDDTQRATEVVNMRQALEMDQAQLSRLIGVHHKTPSRWETGRVVIPQAKFLLIKMFSDAYAAIVAAKEDA